MRESEWEKEKRRGRIFVCSTGGLGGNTVLVARYMARKPSFSIFAAIW